jgi:hypothetical protein
MPWKSSDLRKHSPTDVLLVELLDRGQVRIAALVASNRRSRFLNHLRCARGQRADN